MFPGRASERNENRMALFDSVRPRDDHRKKQAGTSPARRDYGGEENGADLFARRVQEQARARKRPAARQRERTRYGVVSGRLCPLYGLRSELFHCAVVGCSPSRTRINVNAGGEHSQRCSDQGGHQPPDFLLAGLGKNLRRLRTQRGYSLERFSKQCGVSRGMLGQIETGKSMPTLGVLWKIATALDTPFAKLLGSRDEEGTYVLRRDETPVIVSDKGGLQSRALFPAKTTDFPEFYELRISPSHLHLSEAHSPGTRENLVVVSGALEITVGSAAPVLLARGDSIFFEGDVPHSYRNPDDFEAVAHLVVSYLQKTPAAPNGHS